MHKNTDDGRQAQGVHQPVPVGRRSAAGADRGRRANGTTPK